MMTMMMMMIILCSQFSTDMDSLELYLKLDKMDPTLVPESSVKHKTDSYQKMTNDWTEVDNKGKQLMKDVTDVSKDVA